VNGSPTATFVFLFCTLANFMSFFMAWFYLYDTAKAEWQSLQLAAADADQGRSGAEANGDFSFSRDRGGDRVEVGHVAVPGNAALLAEEGANASHLYGDVLVDDLDAPKSVMERIADRDKARLMKQFFFAVSIYIIMAMVVFFVPLFVPIVVQAALLIAYDALLWLFMAGLLIVFRMRESNQFLLLTDAGLGGGETTTELGVLYHDDDGDGDGDGTARRGAAGNSSRRVTPKFTLEDDDELSQEVNDRAAQQGVIIQSLPSPHA
jgi:hypothetical protein